MYIVPKYYLRQRWIEQLTCFAWTVALVDGGRAGIHWAQLEASYKIP